jgi:O-antigen/teichoic acid export membrane protein
VLATVAQIAAIASSALVTIAIARHLGPGATGSFAIAISLFEVALVIFMLGLPAGTTYYVSHGRWRLHSAFRDSQAASAALGAIGMLACAGAYTLSSGSLLEGISWEIALVVAAALPFGMAWRLSATIALARDRYEAYGFFQVVQGGAAVVLGVGLLFAYGLTGAVWGFALSQAVAAVVAGWWVLRYARDHDLPAEAEEHHGIGEAIRFGLKAWGADLLQLVNYRLDIFVLNAFAAAAVVGQYAVAVSLTALGWILPTALQTVLFPRTASLDAAARRGELDPSGSDAAVVSAIRQTSLTLLPTALALVLVLVIGVPIVYGADFDPAIRYGFVLIPGVLALGLTKVLSAVITGRGHPIYNLYIGLVDVPVTLAVYVLLIPPFGGMGAAIGSSASYILTTVLCVGFFKRVTGIGVREAMIPTRAELRALGAGARRLLRR